MAEQSVGWGFGKLAHNPNDQWLIKSANRIMGPFKLSEVIMGLELRHFTLMDEIAAPYGRWVLVRDEQALQAAVKELRNRAESIENTATMTHTMTTSKSFNSTDPFGVVTPPKTPNLDNVKEVKSSRNRTNVFSKGTFWVLGVLVIAGGLIWGWQQFSNKKRGKDSSAEGFSQVLELKSRGFHDRALALANKLKVSDKENPLLDLEIGTYQIALQNQNTAGRKTGGRGRILASLQI